MTINVNCGEVGLGPKRKTVPDENVTSEGSRANKLEADDLTREHARPQPYAKQARPGGSGGLTPRWTLTRGGKEGTAYASPLSHLAGSYAKDGYSFFSSSHQ